MQVWANIDIDKRISIYTNAVSGFNQVIPKSCLLSTEHRRDVHDRCLIMSVDRHVLSNYISCKPNYWRTNTLKEASQNYKDKYFSLIYGDDTNTYNGIPTLSKIRILRQPQDRVLTRFNYDRHWGCVDYVRNLRNLDGFSKKKALVHWRGSTTGSEQRNIAVTQYFDNSLCDIAFSVLCQGYKPEKPEHCKNEIQDFPQMLENKYLLSINGNDKASDINWKLASDSLVFISYPKYESWLMESMLEPWIHYIPLKYDYSDLIEKYKWAESNQDKCVEIIKNANLFIDSNFGDKEKEERIERAVFKYYYDNVNITLE